MAESRLLCCCTLRVWSMAVAWIHIAFYAIATIGMTALIILMTTSDKIADDTFNRVTIPVYDVLCFVSFLLGVFLLSGVKTGNPSKMNLWLVVSGVLTAANAAAIIVGIVTGDLEILVELLSLSYNIFTIWIIYKHRQELLDQEQSTLP